MEKISEDQITAMALLFGLTPPEDYRQQVLADSKRKRDFIDRMGVEEGTLVHETRQLGYSTKLMLKALCEARRGRTVYLKGHSRSASQCLVHETRSMCQTVGFSSGFATQTIREYQERIEIGLDPKKEIILADIECFRGP